MMPVNRSGAFSALLLLCCLASCTMLGAMTEQQGRDAIEAEYPLFKDYENQESFAGKSVLAEKIDGDLYYAYMLLGSGLPIINATCFKVDKEGKVSVTGTFPDSLDSYRGYGRIDPVTCRGIRP